MTQIENPFAGAAVGADFHWHTSRGYQGGTDYKIGPGVTVTAPCDGRALRLSPSEISIEFGPSSFVTVRELKSTTGKYPRNVKRGDPIGITGNEWGGIVRWPHIDRTVRGVRGPFEPLVNVHKTKPADSGTATPILDQGDDETMFQYQKKSGSRFFVHPSLPVTNIGSSDWAANVELGIRTERNVDNTKAEKFRVSHNARVKQITPAAKDNTADNIIEAVLDGLNLPENLASEVSDAVYAKIQAGGVALTSVGVTQVAKATASEFAARLVK